MPPVIKNFRLKKKKPVKKKTNHLICDFYSTALNMVETDYGRCVKSLIM